MEHLGLDMGNDMTTYLLIHPAYSGLNPLMK